MRKLVIIGNGFDLQANLKSRFLDFFKAKEQINLESRFRDPYKNIIKEISLFSLILFNSFIRKDINPFNRYDKESQNFFNNTYQKEFSLDNQINEWMDVEGDILKILKSNAIKKIEKYISNVRTEGFATILKFCTNDGLFEFLATRKDLILSEDYSFNDYLFYELELFEKSFASYLANEVENTAEYLVNSKSIINRIIKDSDEGIVLNFNYTRINFGTNNFKEINVHGDLNNKIIIGIDDEKGLNENLFRFTKTFRKLIDDSSINVLDKEFDEIIIYGHSLGAQDYSYFQSIFDYVKLYESKTTIRFIYSDNFIPEKLISGKQKYKENLANKLFLLLKTYGSTLDNKDNGRNLIHKLLLEGRLKMELSNYIEPK